MSKIRLCIVLLILFFVQSCAVHHPLSGHRSTMHGGHIAIHTVVSLYGGHYGHYRSHGNILGALIIGGIIGHILTEAVHDEAEKLSETEKLGELQSPESNKEEKSK